MYINAKCVWFLKMLNITYIFIICYWYFYYWILKSMHAAKLHVHAYILKQIYFIPAEFILTSIDGDDEEILPPFAVIDSCEIVFYSCT